ncbi:ABC transporter substrate-binding protein [Xaviernesmea oryzae]|uniref:ABC transporter substrate-binding protein n=1 Tax=Xaviernesmea oryzae TaxID=464029 RepID=A0A1Q9AQX1_9HYPH|nr:sugar ABC transporter substrate-binding protein [Xaviernesmea oryzae]OLP57705.1 ABC transporter substrate-binding protein [Xaviernesmea oryzae]SEM05026.1 lactose/L-arabinose transport system substrate-binding protein [Xaviernesmea oryzae]
MIHSTLRARCAAVLLAGASLLAASAAFAGEIKVWCWDPNFNVAIMKEAGERYAKDHPDTKVTVIDFAKSDVEQKLQTALSSGTADGLPDIVLIEDYGAQKYLQSFPGAFAAMSGKVDYAGFAPYKVKLMTVEGQVYGMPFDSGVTGLYYRKDYLEQAGFKPADLENITWDRFIEIGKQVTEKTGKKMIGIDVNDAGFTRILLQSAGRWYFDKDGNLDIAKNPAMKAALEVQQKMFRAGIHRPASGWTDWVNGFTSGDVAAITTGVWITGTVKAQAEQSGKWGVAPIPSLTVEGATHASNLGGSSWYVTENSKVKDEAIDFLNTIFGKDVSFYQKILTERGAVGSLTAARTGEAYNLADPFFGGEKVWQHFSDWLAKVPPVNYGVYTNEVDAAVNAHLPELAKDGVSVDKVLAEIESQAQGQIQ